MTDVTGFMLGHLSEMYFEGGAGVQALLLCYQDIPKLPGVEEYIAARAPTGRHKRNFASYMVI